LCCKQFAQQISAYTVPDSLYYTSFVVSIHESNMLFLNRICLTRYDSLCVKCVTQTTIVVSTLIVAMTYRVVVTTNAVIYAHMFNDVLGGKLLDIEKSLTNGVITQTNGQRKVN
jgi:hypothetical protein